MATLTIVGESGKTYVVHLDGESKGKVEEAGTAVKSAEVKFGTAVDASGSAIATGIMVSFVKLPQS